MSRRAALLLLALACPSSARAGAVWSVNGATVSNAASDQLFGGGYGSAAPDSAGGIYVVWSDSRNFATTGLNVWAQHLDANGSPVAGWPANGLQISTTVTGSCLNAVGARNATCPGVSGDGAGGAFIVWQDWRSGNPQVYAQRVKPDGTIVWTAGGVLVDTSPGGSDQSGGPYLGDDGSLFALVYDSAPLAAGGMNYRVQKLSPANGSQLFGSQGRVISSTTIQSFTYLTLPVTDGANGFYVAWSDTRSGSIKPYAARVDPNGNKLWEIVVASAANNQGITLATVSDGAGGFYEVWTDSRAGGGQIDVYGTHILNTGAPAAGWSTGTSGGNPIAVGAPSYKLLPFVDLYAGDMVTVWQDLTGAHMRARAQRMGAATGLPAWTVNGVSVFAPASPTVDVLEAPILRVSSNNILMGMGWISTNLGTSQEFSVGQAVNPADGSTLFSLSTGVNLGTMEYPGNGSLPRAFQIVASTVDATAIVAWLAGGAGASNIYAQKLSTAGGAAVGGGGGGPATDLKPYLAVVTSDTVIAQWTSVAGAAYIAALSTGSAFATVTASGTIASSYRSTTTSLSAGTSYYFKVKLSTESDAGFVATLSGLTGPAGVSSQAYSTQWGSNGSGAGQFSAPDGIAVDASGNVFVSDKGNNRVQKFDSNGVFISSWGGSGSGNGQFNSPLGIAVDGSGSVYVADGSNSRVQKFDSNGNFLTTWGSIGSGNGQFLTLAGIAVDGSGNVYTTERGNHRVQKFSSNGVYATQWGSTGHADGQFDSPYGIGVDGSNRVYVVDGSNGTDALAHRVSRFDSSGVFQKAWAALGTAPGLLNSARHLAVDAAGNTYVADFFNARVQEFDPSGRLLGYWGSGGSGNGQFISLGGIAVDANGNVFTTEASNHRVQRFGSAVVIPAPPAPSGAAFTGVVFSSLSVQWNLSAGNTYLMALSTSSDFSAPVSSAVGALNQNTTTYTGLSALSTYYFKVKISTNPDASYSAAISTVVPAPPPPGGVQFTAVSTTSISASWTLSTGSSYVIVLSSAAGFASTVSSGTGALNQNTTTYAGIAAGTYYFKVKVATHPDSGYSAVISTTTGAQPGVPQSSPINAATGGNIALGNINFAIPAGAFGAANNTVTTTIPLANTVPGATTGSSGKVTPLGPAFDISLAQPVAHFVSPITASVPVTLPALVKPANVRLAWYDTVYAIWWPIWQSYYDALLQKVIALLYHNTLFAVVVVEASPNLDSLRVFPNPVNFSGAARNTVKFSGLTAQPTIRIYNTVGERVVEIPPAFNAGGTVNDGTSGLAEWNGRNENGNRVARGTYIYVVTDPAGGRKSGLIGVTQ